jgi:hypothetical protein
VGLDLFFFCVALDAEATSDSEFRVPTDGRLGMQQNQISGSYGLYDLAILSKDKRLTRAVKVILKTMFRRLCRKMFQTRI